MTPEEIEKLWMDPRNTSWGVYFCREDPRLIVPNRIKWLGWTLNFGHRWAISVILLLFVAVLVNAIFVVPMLIVSHHQPGPLVVVGVLAVVIAVAILLRAWLSSRTH